MNQSRPRLDQFHNTDPDRDKTVLQQVLTWQPLSVRRDVPSSVGDTHWLPPGSPHRTAGHGTQSCARP